MWQTEPRKEEKISRSPGCITHWSCNLIRSASSSCSFSRSFSFSILSKSAPTGEQIYKQQHEKTMTVMDLWSCIFSFVGCNISFCLFSLVNIDSFTLTLRHVPKMRFKSCFLLSHIPDWKYIPSFLDMYVKQWGFDFNLDQLQPNVCRKLDTFGGPCQMDIGLLKWVLDHWNRFLEESIWIEIFLRLFTKKAKLIVLRFQHVTSGDNTPHKVDAITTSLY